MRSFVGGVEPEELEELDREVGILTEKRQGYNLL